MLPELTRVRLLIEPDDSLFDEELGNSYRVHKGDIGTIIEVYPGPPVGYCVDFTDLDFDDGHGNSCSFLDLREDQVEPV